jgi:hypothetical protein
VKGAGDPGVSRESGKKIEPALEKAFESVPGGGDVRVISFAHPEVRCHHIGRGRPR